MGIAGAVFVGYQVVGFAHAGRARGGVVRVGGEEVDPAILEEVVRHALGLLAFVAGK